MNAPPNTVLPWNPGTTPLMLAPMQGVTNRSVRGYFIETVRPDVVFTEFVRVAGGSRKRVAASDLREIGPGDGVPLVVQLIGRDRAALVEAAQVASAAGARHINFNLGCPYGRMTTGPVGGALLQHPELLAELIPALRDACRGSFSIKLRAGYDNHDDAFALLPLCESVGIDFLILHPRTVLQEYEGVADHRVTAAMARATRLPVIANGDLRSARQGKKLLQESGVAGLMLGRGAFADPLLFARLRGTAPETASRPERLAQLRAAIEEILARYLHLFCGEAQVLSKLKGVLTTMEDPLFQADLPPLRKAKTLSAFRERLAEIG